MNEKEQNNFKTAEKKRTKKKYKAPELIIHGNVKEITSAGGFMNPEIVDPWQMEGGGSPP